MSNFKDLIENTLSENQGLKFVEDIVYLLFDLISKTINIDNAELIFKNLDDIQIILAKAVFKNEIEVTPFLRQFIYEFDRIDDFETKCDLYNRIKEGIPLL